jgi:hypothetical protein
MDFHRKSLVSRVCKRLERDTHYFQNNLSVLKLTRQVTKHTRLDPEQPPVVFFNASTRIKGMSLNAAFSFLAALGVQLSGTPVVHFACRSGMSRCVLGTQRDDPSALPPCQACIHQSRWLYANAPAVWFKYQPDAQLARELGSLDTPALMAFEFNGIPLGELVTPSLRWVLRRHDLRDDEATRSFLREYVLSAFSVAQQFERFLDQTNPQAVVLFNGMMYPEAVARWAALRRGIRVITHEVGMQPLSAFFTDGEATAYPIDIPEDFKLSPEQETRLDEYLEQRFKGRFSMAGIQFWPEINGLSEAFLEQASRFQQIVPVFTNVIFDTSQAHANRVFPDMFAWLDHVLELIRRHPETLFVIRAHPDEMRRGKESRQTVEEWASRRGINDLSNTIFVSPVDHLSSYELIQRSKFVMVYNSSIGLEASLMGAAVLCAGKARYTQTPTVFFPQTSEAYLRTAEEFLAEESISAPEVFRENARRFLYYQLFITSLPFDRFLQPHPSMAGFVQLRPFHWQNLTPAVSPTMRALLRGILEGLSFVLDYEEGNGEVLLKSENQDSSSKFT